MERELNCFVSCKDANFLGKKISAFSLFPISHIDFLVCLSDVQLDLYFLISSKKKFPFPCFVLSIRCLVIKCLCCQNTNFCDFFFYYLIFIGDTIVPTYICLSIILWQIYIWGVFIKFYFVVVAYFLSGDIKICFYV